MAKKKKKSHRAHLAELARRLESREYGEELAARQIWYVTGARCHRSSGRCDEVKS